MLKSSRIQSIPAGVAALLLAGVLGDTPVQAQNFQNFSTANFSQMSSVSSSGGGTRAIPTAPSGGFVSSGTFTPVSTSVSTASVATAPVLATSVSPIMTATTAVMTPVITNVMTSSTIGTFNPAVTSGTFASNATNSLPLAGTFASNISGNIVGTFTNVANPVAGGVKNVGIGVLNTGANTPFFNVVLNSGAAEPKSAAVSAVSGVVTRAAETVSNIQHHVQGERGAEHAGECEHGSAGGAVSSLAKLVGGDKEHRPEDSANNPIVPVVPSFNPNGSGLAGTSGAISSVLVSVQQQSQLTLFSSTNQVLQGTRGQVFGGDAGTLLSQQRDMIILHKGRLAVDSGKQTTIVKTSKGDVKLAPSTIAIIENQVGQPLQILALQGNESAVSISGPATRGIEVTARAGQQLIVSEKEDEMIPVEGAETIVSGGVEMRSSVKRAEISVNTVVEEYHRRAGKMARLASLGANPADTTPVLSRRAPGPDNWNLFGEKTNTPMQVVAQPGAQFQQDEKGNIKLLFGSLFIAAKNNSTISSTFATVELKRNGVSMIEVDDKICRVKSFSGPGDLKVTSGSASYDLAPGHELLICKAAPGETEIIPADAIARRNRTQSKLVDGHHHLLNDFSICSMIRYPGYRKMIAEADASGKLADKILKTAVVVEMVTRTRGQYAYSSLYAQEADKQKLSSAK